MDIHQTVRADRVCSVFCVRGQCSMRFNAAEHTQNNWFEHKFESFISCCFRLKSAAGADDD